MKDPKTIFYLCDGYVEGCAKSNCYRYGGQCYKTSNVQHAIEDFPRDVILKKDGIRIKLHDLIVLGVITSRDRITVIDDHDFHRGAWVEDHMLKYWGAEIAGCKKDEDGTWRIEVKKEG